MARKNWNTVWTFFAILGFWLPLGSFAAIRVGLVLDRGGKDDKSFNAAAYQGFIKAQKELGIEGKVVEATDDNAFEPLLRKFAQEKYDLIVAIGIAQVEPIKRVAARFGDRHFALVDAEAKGADGKQLSNVGSLLFEEHEGSFVVGALAALKSKTGKVGFIGGMDVPLIRRFQMGFEAGARSVQPQIKVSSNYVGVTADSWNNPTRAKELALAQYDQGVDIIFAAAGASGMGLFDAAEARKQFAIGVDSNQNWIKPGRVLTSMLKRVDVAVFEAIRETKDGKFQAGVKRFGLHNGGVDYALDQHNKALIASAEVQRLDRIKKDIQSGKVQVPDYYKNPKMK